MQKPHKGCSPDPQNGASLLKGALHPQSGSHTFEGKAESALLRRVQSLVPHTLAPRISRSPIHKYYV